MKLNWGNVLWLLVVIGLLLAVAANTIAKREREAAKKLSIDSKNSR
jgi:hypothetical protein